MENFKEQKNDISLFELQVDNSVSDYLRETARWAKFLAITGFVFCGLIALGILGSAMTGNRSQMGNEYSYLVGLVGLVLCLPILFFPCLYLYNFATRMQHALRGNDQEQLIRSFRNLKACYRFMGILTIIYIAMMILLVLFNLFGALR